MTQPTGYYNPLLTGVLGGQSYAPGALSQSAQSFAPGPLSHLAYQMAGKPTMGPFADRGSPPAVANIGAGAQGPGTGGGAGGTALGILSELAKNPKLVKSGVQGIQSLLGLGSPSLAAFASGAPADAAVSQALGSVGSQVAPTSSAIQASNDAALNAMNGGSLGASGGLLSLEGLGSGAAADAAIASTLAPTVGSELGTTAAGIEAANSAALSGGGIFGATGSGAAAAAAIPLAILAAAAFVPDSSELTPEKIAQMESNITAATKANGGPLTAASTLNPNGTVNQQAYQNLSDLMTLQSENPTEFAKAGGTGQITQYLQSLGYEPIDWSKVNDASGSGYNTGNTSGRQL